MNKAILIGNLAGDPETTTVGGVQKCTFRMAVQREYKNANGEREADFLTIVAWRQLAELCARYLAKGRKVGVDGSIQTRSYDAQDGTKRYVTEIIAKGIEFLSSRDDSQQAAPQQRAPQAAAPASQMDFSEVDDSELPF